MNGTEFARISGNYSTVYIGTWALLGQSFENNESYIRLYGYFYYPGTNSTGVGSSGNFDGFYLDGTYISSGSYRYYHGYTELGYKDITVKHDDYGTFPGRSIGISADSYHMSGSTTGSIAYGAIATIPRATACPNLDGYIESSIPITLNPAVSTFKHRLYYSYNGKTGYYPSKDSFFANTGSLDLDKTFYDKTPNSSGTGSLTLYTYDANGNSIGSKTGTLTARCDSEKCKPTITATIFDTNTKTIELTGDENKLVKGYSYPVIEFTISPKNGATISKQTINNEVMGASPHSINNNTTGTFEIIATDSRGFSTTLSRTNDLVDYAPLRLDFTAFRTSPTSSEIKVNFTGIYFNDSFGSVSNALSLSWKYRIKGSADWVTGGTLTKDTHYKISENKFYSGTGSSASDISLSTSLFPYNNAYEVAIFYNDKLVDTYTSKPVPKGKPVVNWADDLFNVNGEFTINETTFLDIVYPVGSIYMSINETNPKDLFGGTWVQLKDRFLLGTGDTYTNGTTGGEAKHTLTVNEIPSHNHTQDSHMHTVQTFPYSGSSVNYYNIAHPNYRGGNVDANTSWTGGYTTWATPAIHNSGGGASHNNMPPYLTVYMWKRTA